MTEKPSGFTRMTPTERREVHAIPTWVALRWIFVALVRGPEYAERYIRPQDRA